MENLELFVQALNHDLKSPINDLKMKLYLIQKESVAPFSPQQQELYTLAQTKPESCWILSTNCYKILLIIKVYM